MELTQNLMDLNTEEAKINFALENKKVSSDDRIKGLVHLRFRFAFSKNYHVLSSVIEKSRTPKTESFFFHY